MKVKRNVEKFGNNNVHDTNLIYSRVLALHQSRDIIVKTVRNHEHLPLPTPPCLTMKAK